MRRFLLIILLCCISCTSLLAQSRCDVNGDGRVDISDANAIIGYICGTKGDTINAPEKQSYRRTIISYIVGDNSLSDELESDISEMVTGSKSLADDCRLVIYADIDGGKPYIAEVGNGQKTIVREYPEDFCSVNPDSMASVMQWIVKKYPADEYGTILEGHGNGPIILYDTISTQQPATRAYGYDNTSSGSDNMWMNIPSLAGVFSSLPHMGFIFFDCCCMGNVETAYELRKATDYFIAPVSEIPAKGAPYNKVIPILSAEKTGLGQEIIDAYINGCKFSDVCGMCMTAIKSSELEALRDATKRLLQKMYDKQCASSGDRLSVSTKHAIYYYRGNETDATPSLHDMKSIFRIACTEGTISQQDFDEWNVALERAVVYKSMPKNDDTNPLWLSTRVNFYTFRDYFDEDHYGALSMIFPDEYYDYAIYKGYPSVNNTMFKLQWCNTVGWHDFGW